MSGVWMVWIAMVIVSLSGLPAVVFPRHSSTGQKGATLLLGAGSLLGLGGLAASLANADPVLLHSAPCLPWGAFTVGIDAVSTLFLALVFVVPALGSAYGLAYWRPSEHGQTAPRLAVFEGLLAGSMALVVLARDGVLFLVAWEVMALSAWFAATVEDDDPAVVRAGWVYLIATHLGTLCLVAMFALWRQATGSFALAPAPAILPGLATPILALAMVGFGAKAGLMPLHVWLPGAHAGAPSHVSAVMSGVMLKMGIYGIVRMTMLVPIASVWWGGGLLAIGALSAVAGIAFAIGQNDLKRLLAYSSIENVGIIAMGLGLALVGRSAHRPDWILLGLGGALLHVWNHGLLKSLLFLGAGAVLHATHTRDIDQLGGLARRMPQVTALFILGVVGICGLPPLNGFVGEWMLYLGLFRTLSAAPGTPTAGAAAAAVVLAMVGALAVACFVKLVGVAFLGSSRRPETDSASDPSAWMVVPMAVLAGSCVLLGLLPTVVTGLLEDATRTWAGPAAAATPPLAELPPLASLAAAGWALLATTGVVATLAWSRARRRAAAGAGTWDCGYALPGVRMQYTGSSFGQTLVTQFRFVLWPRTRQPVVEGTFPAPAIFRSAVPDAVLDRVVLPAFRAGGRCLSKARIFQQGQIQTYVLYILAILIVLLVWGPSGGPR